jgi:hypothetical protein
VNDLASVGIIDEGPVTCFAQPLSARPQPYALAERCPVAAVATPIGKGRVRPASREHGGIAGPVRQVTPDAVRGLGQLTTVSRTEIRRFVTVGTQPRNGREGHACVIGSVRRVAGQARIGHREVRRRQFARNGCLEPVMAHQAQRRLRLSECDGCSFIRDVDVVTGGAVIDSHRVDDSSILEQVVVTRRAHGRFDTD